MTNNLSERIIAVLVGGPADFPEEWRTRDTDSGVEKIKIPHRGGHEHFERTDRAADGAGEGEVVYLWSMRTKIAE